MKIIQSFWAGNRNIVEESFGWHSPRFHALSWVLSSLQLSKFYDVELYTDQVGYDFFITKLQLPYKKVHVVLDELNDYSKDFWALPKIRTYTLQNEPYLHIDGDVFLWKPFNTNLLKSEFISQNLEVTTDYYKTMWSEIFPHLDFLPSEMNGYVTAQNNFACNMGIFGGKNVEFLKKYADKSFEFAVRNKNLSEKINASQFNMFFEQVLFQEMLTISNKTCNFLFDEVSNDNDYKGFGDFHKVPHEKTYLHLLGVYKRNFQVCKMLESYVMLNHPDYFKKITESFDDYKSLINHPKFENLLSIDKEKYLDNFKSAISNQEIKIFDDYTLGLRDMNASNSYFMLYDSIKTQKDFNIFLVPSFEIFKRPYEGEEITYLKIKEFNEEYTIIPSDEIDYILFIFFENKPSYKKLIEDMLNLLEEDAEEIKEEFIDMINDRLGYYLKHKLILIY